jgi:UDP-glucose 4-epimerase
MKRILVTGGAGFIGTHLCRALIRQGFKVRSLDVKLAKFPVKDVEYLSGDLSNEEALRQALEGCEAVFHLAALVSVPLCQQYPLLSYETNFLGTCRLLEAIRTAPQPIRFIFASSCAVYGKLGAAGRDLSENLPLESPLSVYAAQKLASEHAAQLFHQAYGLETVVLRFFNVFGRGQVSDSSYSGVISIFLDRIQKTLPLELHGGGGQTRDFISIGEVVEACLKTLSLPADGCDGLAINIGSGRAVTIREVAETLQEITGKKVTLLAGPSRSADVPHSLANIQRAQQLLDWKPYKGLKTAFQELTGDRAGGDPETLW